jgi:hypothetical protein
LANASLSAERELLRRLKAGTLATDFPRVPRPLTLGIGQSMGGCMTIVQQGRSHCYDGIAILGFSAVHTHPPVRPGRRPVVMPWLTRDFRADCAKPLNNLVLEAVSNQADEPRDELGMAWAFYYDDIPQPVVELDQTNYRTRQGPMPPWRSASVPGTAGIWTLTPGAVAPEASAILAPVLVGMGVRDTLVDPRGELRAYRSARSVDFFMCPKMGHMHNFASTRELLWKRIERFADWVADVKTTLADTTAISL